MIRTVGRPGPTPLDTRYKTLLGTLISWSHRSEKQAVALLKSHEWSVQSAIEAFYDSGMTGEGSSFAAAAAVSSSLASATSKLASPAKGTPASRIDDAFAKYEGGSHGD